MLTYRFSILLLASVAVVTACGCPQARVTAPNLDADQGTALALREVLESGAASGGAAATLAEPTGWATLTGQFQMNGTPPRRASLNVDKDTEVCAPGGTQVLGESVVVGAAGGIKNVLIYLDMDIPADDPKWEHESFAANKTGEVTFDQKACIFLSHVMAMRSQQTLLILNSDPVLHNTNIQAGRGAIPFNGSIPSNGQSRYQPGGQTDRPFPISCSVHPWMSAHMITRDNPYFAVTDDEGRFEIPFVPAGVKLRFRVWQEQAKFLQAVTVEGAATKWKQGRFDLTLTPDERREMGVSVDAALFQ